jgi:DNA repair exonuclease SbcCD nuclease subunit
MRVLCVGDVHVADHPPSIRTDGYKDQILKKLWQTVEIAKDEKVDAVIWVGDAFHAKAPSRTSHQLVQAIMGICYAYPVPVFIVPGNHDLSYDRIQSLTQQPLGVVYRSGAATMGVGPMYFAGDGEAQVFGVPWFPDWADKLPGFLETSMESKLIIAHAPIMPPGVSAPFDYIAAEDFADLIPWPGIPVFYGHIHENHGIYTVGTHVFCNFGAISRGSLHEESVRRKPAVAVFDSTAAPPFTRIELDHLPVEQVFKLAVKEAEDFHTEKLTEFLESVGMTELEGLSIEAVLAHIQAMGLDADTLAQVSECLEVAMEREPV